MKKNRLFLRYIDDLLDSDESYFDKTTKNNKKKTKRFYLTEIKVHKAHSFDTEAPILDEDLSASMAKNVDLLVNDKRDDT